MRPSKKQRPFYLIDLIPLSFPPPTTMLSEFFDKLVLVTVCLRIPVIDTHLLLSVPNIFSINSSKSFWVGSPG